MGMVTESLAPAKFLACICHVLMVISVFWTYKQNLKTGLPEGYSSDDELLARVSVYFCLIISLAMQIFEILLLFLGYSLFFDAGNLVQVIFHVLGSVITSWFILEDWEYKGIWGIWFFTVLIPFFIDLAMLVKAKNFYQT
jgi:hypothetical protein